MPTRPAQRPAAAAGSGKATVVPPSPDKVSAAPAFRSKQWISFSPKVPVCPASCARRQPSGAIGRCSRKGRAGEDDP